MPLGPQAFALSAPGPLGNTRVLSVHNDGASTLHVTSIEPATAAPWISAEPTDFYVAPGSIVPVQLAIDFAQAPAGSAVTQLSVVSDDPDENPYPTGVLVTVTNTAADTDGDEVPDSADNCTLVANPSQCDSDGDNFGNRCDGDLNNSGATNSQDFVLFRAQLGQPSVDPTYNQADLNCSGSVNSQDYVLFRSLLGSAPGPSGLVP